MTIKVKGRGIVKRDTPQGRPVNQYDIPKKKSGWTLDKTLALIDKEIAKRREPK